MSVWRTSLRDGELALVILCSLVGCASRERATSGLSTGPVADKDARLPAATLAAADYQQPIGTPHPLQVITAADSGRWIVACQARSDTDGRDGIHVELGFHGDISGDAMIPYLFRGGGDGQAIDDFVGASRDDRWIAVVRNGKLVLVDDVAGTETTIVDADTRPDQRGHARVASFDPSNKRLVYFRGVGGDAHVVVRDLERQREREVVIPKILAWRVVPESIGSWARVLFVREDTDHDGRLEWPTVKTDAPLGKPCTGRAAASSTFGATGDEIRSAWINLDTGEVRDAASILAYLDSDPISKAFDRSIRVGATTVVPATCDGELLAFARNPLRLVVTCAASGKSAPIELFGPAFHAKLDGTSAPRGAKREPRLIDSPYLCSGAETCNALDTGKPLHLRGGVVTMSKAKILTHDREDYFVTDGDSGALHQLHGVDGYPVAAAGEMVAIGTSVIDISQARVLGEAPRRPIAVDEKGRALVASSGGDREFPSGPLRWIEPVPVAATDAPPDATWTIAGSVVDEHGKPVSNALVTVTEAQFKNNADGTSSPTSPWIPPGVAAKGMGAFASFSQFALPTRTDAQGHFTWSPVLPGPHAIMVIADDGRVGSIDTIRNGESNVKIVLRAPASLRVKCPGVQPMDPDLGAGGVDILAGARRLGAACDETIGGLPPGHYVLAAKQSAFKYAGVEIDLRSGQKAEAVLALTPWGHIAGRVVEYPGDKPVAGVACDARWPFGSHDIDGDPDETSKADGTFELKISQGKIHVWCEGRDFAPGMSNVVLGPTLASVTVRVVRLRSGGVDAGAEFEAEADGARLTKVNKIAARSGLQPGDLVRAVDDVPLAGLSRQSMAALAFFWPRDATPKWTVVRNGKTLVVPAKP